MNKCKHKCKWEKTGLARYTDPLEEEMECKTCGRKRWKEGAGLKKIKCGTKEWEDFRRRHFNDN